MTGMARARYTLEFKQEAIRLVQGGQTVASAAKTLGLSDQTLHNWLKAETAGRLREVAGKAISAEQMEIARLKAELAKARMERDILKNAAVYFARESRRNTPLSRNIESFGRWRRNAGCWRSAPAAIGNIERARRTSAPFNSAAGSAMWRCWFTSRRSSAR